MRKSWIIASLLFLLHTGFSNAAEADRDYCSRNNLGWHFYCDPEREKAEEAKEDAAMLQTPKEQLTAIQEKLEELRVTAVMRPTEENVAAYISFQQEQMNRAAKFSRVWRRVQWKNPELDYKVKRPSTTQGLNVMYQEDREKKKQALNDLKERYGLFYFYKGNDAKSAAFASTVKHFVDYHKLEIRAVSLDGVIVKEFPDSLIDNGEVKELGVKTDMMPSIALYDIEVKKLIPISAGMIGTEDLENRIYLLTKVEEVDDEDF